jgi:hypothetical protein
LAPIKDWAGDNGSTGSGIFQDREVASRLLGLAAEDLKYEPGHDGAHSTEEVMPKWLRGPWTPEDFPEGMIDWGGDAVDDQPQDEDKPRDIAEVGDEGWPYPDDDRNGE